MARIRTVKPEYWTFEPVLACSRDARLLFIGMWNFCDDGGVHPASVATLKAEVLPGDDVSAATVMQWVDELIEQRLLTEYEADGREYWRVADWQRDQKIERPTLRHPSGDAGDTGDARHPRRLGGKQRQLLLGKIRAEHGDACHLCGDANANTLLKVGSSPTANPYETSVYRLICPTCKRKSRDGDAQVTQGDASDVDGDSPPEGKGVEKEGSFIHTAPTRNELSTAVPTTAAQVSFVMRRHSIDAGPANPTVIALAEQGIDLQLLEDACREAREHKPDERISVNYIAKKLEGWKRDAQRVDVRGATRRNNPAAAWWLSAASMNAKARELGIPEAKVGEMPDAFKARIQATINAKAQGAR